MINKVLNVGDVRRVIKESSSEFKAVMGKNVEADNKKNNDKSYKDSEKKVKEFDGGLKKEAKKETLDRTFDQNRTTLDYIPSTEPSKEYKERVKAQAKGYVSVEDEKSGSDSKNGKFDDDARIYKAFKDNAEIRNSERDELAHSGLSGDKMKKHEVATMYESKNLKPKRLVFKKTVFINESQMLSRIPEEYKKDGQIIYMKDKSDNEYIVECVKNKKNDIIETNIVHYNNERILNEQVNRMNQLFNYNTNEAFNTQRDKTSKDIGDMLNIVRNNK